MRHPLSLVDRAIAEAQQKLDSADRDIAVCILNLRGMTLAGRLMDKKEAKREAERHIRSALAMSQGMSQELDVHGLTVGQGSRSDERPHSSSHTRRSEGSEFCVH